MININVSEVNNVKIVLLIVTYNSEKFMRKLCYSILAQDYDLSQVLLVVVDNNSNDNTYNRIIECVKNSIENRLNVITLKLGRNLGFTPANNIGLALATKILGNLNGKIVLLLNPDTYILSKDFFRKIEKLLEILPLVGFSTISGKGDVIDSIGAFIDYLGNPQDLFCCVRLTDSIKEFLDKSLPKIYYMPLACFAAVAIRGDVIQKIGFLRNDYVMYFDDTEYCLRSWSRGIPITIYRDFMVWHARGGTQKSFREPTSRRRYGNDGIFLDIPYHFSKNNLLLAYEYLGLFRYVLRMLLYGIIGAITNRKHLAFSIIDSLRIIAKRRIRTKRLPKGLIPKDPKTLVLLWALKYLINYPNRGMKEAVAYGTKRASIEYIKHRFYKRSLVTK